MIQYVPPTKRRRWPGVLLLAVVLVVFLLLISACGNPNSTDGMVKPTLPTTPSVQIDDDHDSNGIKIRLPEPYPDFFITCAKGRLFAITAVENSQARQDAAGGGAITYIGPCSNG